IHAPRSPSVHSKVAVVRNALLYLNPSAVPARRPTMPNRLGPSRCSPPLSMVWQIAHWRTNAASPLATSAAWLAVGPKLMQAIAITDASGNAGPYRRTFLIGLCRPMGTPYLFCPHAAFRPALVILATRV